MRLIDLERRLTALEATRGTAPPTAILTDRPIGDPAGDLEAADALANWRAWVARGRATVINGVLCAVRPPLTEAEWVAAFVTVH